MLVLVFSGLLMFMPVHVRERGDRLKPAIPGRIFLALLRLLTSFDPVLELPWMFVSTITKPTAALPSTGEFALVVSMLIAAIDNRLRFVLNRKGNATVT